jgi:uncharacterized membrane protein
MKRKKQRKAEHKEAVGETSVKKPKTRAIHVPALALKILSVVLSVILLAALTLYVLGKMPARGFFSLAVLLAVIAFFVLPWMKKKYAA